MGFIIILIIIVIIACAVMKDTKEGKLVIFLGGVAVLAGLGSLILSFLKYISYGALLAILVLLGIMLYKKIFNESE